MSLVRSGWTTRWRHPTVAILLVLGLVLLVPAAVSDPGKQKQPVSPAEVTGTWSQTRDAPVIVDTPANLQAAFTNEMNARERYLAYAKAADV